MRRQDNKWHIAIAQGIGNSYCVALAQPDIKKKINDAGIDVAGGTPQQFADFLQAEMKKWAKVAKDANIQPE